METKLEPEYRQSLESQLAQKNEELKAHRESRPAPVTKPDVDQATQQAVSTIAATINGKKDAANQLETQIASLREQQRTLAISLSSIEKLLAKLGNLERSFADFQKECAADLQTLGLSFTEIATLTINRTALHAKRSTLTAQKDDLDKQLDPTAAGNLIVQLEQARKEITQFQDQLDAPNKNYQAFLSAEEAWQKKEIALIGSPTSAGSVKQLEAEIAALAGVPPTLAELVKQRLAKAIEIHREVDPRNWTGRIVNPQSEERSTCQRRENCIARS